MIEMRTLQIVSGIISVFFGIFALVFVSILPMMGIYFDYNSHGASMEPALTDAVEIRLSPERAPYEDLQVGDIILFRQADYRENSGPPGEAYAPEWNKDHTKLHFVSQTELEESPKYMHVQHRIIAINENGLVTKGDNNAFQDFLSVKSKDYEGKIVWHMNHINWLFKAMYRYGLWAVCVILFLVTSFYVSDRKMSNVIPNDSQYGSDDRKSSRKGN